MTQPVKVGNEISYGEHNIVCPQCDGDYTRPIGAVFGEPGNIVVEFECEVCGVLPPMKMYFHKGVTYIQWGL